MKLLIYINLLLGNPKKKLLKLYKILINIHLKEANVKPNTI